MPSARSAARVSTASGAGGPSSALRQRSQRDQPWADLQSPHKGHHRKGTLECRRLVVVVVVVAVGAVGAVGAGGVVAVVAVVAVLGVVRVVVVVVVVVAVFVVVVVRTVL